MAESGSAPSAGIRTIGPPIVLLLTLACEQSTPPPEPMAVLQPYRAEAAENCYDQTAAIVGHRVSKQNEKVFDARCVDASKGCFSVMIEGTYSTGLIEKPAQAYCLTDAKGGVLDATVSYEKSDVMTVRWLSKPTSDAGAP